MPANSSEKLKSRIIATANRLRMVQVDFADEGEQTRIDYLCEELERALKKVLPEEREEFLKGLMIRFPIGDFSVQPTLEQHKAEGGATIDESTLKDPDFLVHLLSKITSTLPSDKKELIARHLQEAGLVPQIQQGYSDTSVQQLKSELEIGDLSGFDPQRLTELFILLAGFISRLEPVIGGTWRRLSPRSSIRPPSGVKKTMKQFICNDPKVSQEKLADELKQLRQLITAIITAASQVGSQFAKRHISRFSPSEIAVLVRMERGGLLVSNEVKCWRKYLELADALTEEAIEAEIRKTVVDYVESLVKGMGR